MGVRGLNSYVEQSAPHVCQRVSIPELAARYRQGRPELPVLLVDGMAMLRKLYVGALEWVFGGQWRQFVALVQHFIHTFRQAGVRLAFVFDGSVESKKRETWLERRQRNQTQMEQLFANISRNHQQPPDSQFQLPSALASMVPFMLRCVCDCEVRYSLGEADHEIARMASEWSECFAVLSEDTDFLIFDTKPYLSIKHLNSYSMETVLYCRDSLASHLCLDICQLPLLSCLMGNDVISFQQLRPFHQWVVGTQRINFQVLVPELARMIRNHGWTSNRLGDVEATTGIPLALIKEGLTSYSLQCADPPLSENPFENLFRQRHIYSMNCAQVYTALVKKELGFSECMEDPPSTGLMPSCLLMKPMRQRWYYLLTGGEVTEWHTYAGQASRMSVIIAPMPFTTRERTDWKRLWNEQRDDDGYRWDVFLSCLGVTLLPEDLLDIAPGIATLAIITNYFLLQPNGERTLTRWEVDALLVQAISPLASDLLFLQKLQVNYVDERAVHMASLVLRALVTVLCVSQCCSEPLPTHAAMPWHFFDGKLFHHFYLKSKSGTPTSDMYNHDPELVRSHRQLYEIITRGTYLGSSSVD